MSLITLTKDRSVLVQNDAKNALPSSMLKKPWTELSGLFWILIDEYDVQRTHASNFYPYSNLVN